MSYAYRQRRKRIKKMGWAKYREWLREKLLAEVGPGITLEELMKLRRGK